MPQQPLQIAGGSVTARPASSMTLGDVLFRLAIISPTDYKAIETLARAAFARSWPPDGDQLFLNPPQRPDILRR